MILVENRTSDGAFVERVAKDLDNGLRSLWAQEGVPIRIDSVGGKGQMREEVKKRVQGLPFRPRLVVIIDSDRKGPGPPSTTARQLADTCQQLNLSCWVLAKREAENYLPRILLDERQNAGGDHSRLVELWDDPDEDQKDFFDMKVGLPETLSGSEEVLFETLPESARKLLTIGFGKNVYKCWTLWNVQAKSALRDRGRGDLEHGIALIQREV